MLSPEVLHFKEPASVFKSQKIDKNTCFQKISHFNFVHLITVVLPDVTTIKNSFGEELTSCDYYKILSINIGDLVTEPFLKKFINSGNLHLLSINTRIDCDNCIAISTGKLLLHLDKLTFQTLGLEGKVSHFNNLAKEKYNSVLQVLCDNCPNIQSLDVTSSRSVTDRSISSLLKCVDLKELQLHRTSVTTEGLAQLLRGLPKIQDIGRCDEFGNVVKCLYQILNATGPFAMKKIQTRDLARENLRLFVDMFPNIECISLFHDEQVSDLTVFSSLDHLRELKLLSCAFYSDYLKQLLEVRGTNITNLHLEHVEEIDLNVLMHVSRYCPYLKHLVLYNCDFSSGNSILNLCNAPQFKNLERIFWMVDGALTYLEYILLNACNIKNIQLGSSTGINHSSIEKILKRNPMKNLEELRILFSNDMNMKTVELLLASCVNLKVLSELESWQGISVEELKSFKKYIVQNNYDLDIRPTLSYY